RERTLNFQETIEDFSALRAPCCQLLIGLFVNLFLLMQLIGDIKRGENSNFAGINRQSSRGNFTHTLVDIVGQLLNVFRIAIRANRVSLIIDLYFYRRRSRRIGTFSQTNSIVTHLGAASAASGSIAITASSIASTFNLINSRSDN